MHNIGTDFVWFMGVVEDRNDPLQMGRVRVRTHWQTADKDILPTDDLPWAQVVVPTSVGSGDFGSSPTGYAEGSWVVGFFMDGEHKQHPLIVGAISGFPTLVADTDKGFNDPRGVYPQRINEPDMNRLLRTRSITDAARTEGITDETTVNTLIHESIPFRNNMIDDLTGEPKPARNTEYPYGWVRETESGHIEEWDDTLGSERIMRMHRTGTLEEIHPNGDRVNRVVNNNYHVIFGNDNIRVRGDCKIYVDGDASIYVRGNSVNHVDGNYNNHIGGDYNLNVGGNINVTTDGTYTTNAKGAVSTITNSTYNLDSTSDLNISTKTKLLIESENTFDINTKNKFEVKAANIDLNSSDKDIVFYSARDIISYYCNETRAFNLCVFDIPKNIAVATASDALILNSYPLSSIPDTTPLNNKKLQTGVPIKQVYVEKLGQAPGGSGTAVEIPNSGRDESASRTESDYSSSIEATSSVTPIGNNSISSTNSVIDKECEDLEHVNVFDVAWTAASLGPDAWKDNDTYKGTELYPNGNPRIISLFDELGFLSAVQGIASRNNKKVDQVAWCTAFVGAMLRRSGNKYLKTLGSRQYEFNADTIGSLITKTYNPDIMQRGDILVFWRDSKNSEKGHIGFWTGNTNVPSGRIQCLGGNQSSTVKISNYPVNGISFGLAAVVRPNWCHDGVTPQPNSKIIFRETT